MAKRSEIDTIKSKLDIIAVASEYLPSLRRTGKNHFSVCPFHQENSPSFSLNEDIQRFKCFGCGESGDVITFIQKIEGVEFPKALEMAAKRAGVELSREMSYKTDKAYHEKKKIYEVNHLTAQFYNHILLKHAKGEVGRNYAKQRQVSQEQIKEFLIGYAPQSFDNLKNFLTKKGFSEKDLVEYSLLASKNGRNYDKFRNRLMFPIFNHTGDIVGFSGRVIDKDSSPKYLNSSETSVYRKSEILYGLFQAKGAIRQQGCVIVVEGNIDVPMAHKVGIKNVVAPMGTALTQQQLKLLKRYTDNIHFAFDSDDAGEVALIRSFQIAEKLELKSKVINLGNYSDLDEMIVDNPKNALKTVENAENLIDNLIQRYSKKFNLSTADGKSEFVKNIIPILSKVKDEVEKSHYISQISNLVEVEQEILLKRINTHDKSKKIESLQTSKPKPDKVKKQSSGKRTSSYYILAYLIQNKVLIQKDHDLSFIENLSFQKIYSLIKNNNKIENVINKLDDSLKQVFIELSLTKLGEFQTPLELENSFEELIAKVKNEQIKKKIKALNTKIKKNEALNKDVTDLLAELQSLSTGLK